MNTFIALIGAFILPIAMGEDTTSDMTPLEAQQLNTLSKWYDEFNMISRGFSPKIVHKFMETKGVPLPNIEHENDKFQMKHFEQQKHVHFDVPSTEEPRLVMVEEPVSEPEKVLEQEVEEIIKPRSEEEEEEERITRRESSLKLMKKMLLLPHLLFGHALRDSLRQDDEKEDETEESPFKLSDDESFSRGWPGQEKTEQMDEKERPHSSLMPLAMVISISSSPSDKGDKPLNVEEEKKRDKEEPPKEEPQKEEQSDAVFPFANSGDNDKVSFGPLMSAILGDARAAFVGGDDDCEDCGEVDESQSKNNEQNQASEEQQKSEDDWTRHEVEQVPVKPDEVQRLPSPFMMMMHQPLMNPFHPFHPFFIPRVPEKSWSLDPNDKFYTGQLPQSDAFHPMEKQQQQQMWLP